MTTANAAVIRLETAIDKGSILFLILGLALGAATALLGA